ncbi:PTS sugar transporter subunit IIA [Oceanivirga salmonicida]|uniref:PTS sugar transporter subunit IIA n=1 Tax=Oceanivirga salmonicida TaxID=1769291 RepID=UPI000831A9C3|nr:hypothetical protein [Oceanivirga salmonicida]
MKKLIATHGKMSEGLKSSLELILGPINDIEIITAYIDGIKIEEEFEKWLSKLRKNEKSVVFTDIEGGSVNQYILSKKTENIILITGVNLPLLLEFCSDEEIDFEELITNSKKEIKKIEEVKKYVDDFDF